MLQALAGVDQVHDGVAAEHHPVGDQRAVAAQRIALGAQDLDAETSVAGTDVWDAQLKAEYTKAAEALKDLSSN